MGRGVINFFLLPFHLTYHTANFNGAGGIGLVPLALAPLGLLACRRDWFARAVGAVGLLLTVAWYLTDQESRFLVPVYVIAAIFGVMGWRYAERVSPRRGALLGLLTVALSISYGLFMIGSAVAEDVHTAVSPRYAERRGDEEIPFVESFRFLNSNPAVRKVLILNPHVPAFYLEREYLKPWGERGERAIPGVQNLAQVLEELPQLGVTHILDVRFGGAPFALPEHPVGMTLVFKKRGERVYQICPAGALSRNAPARPIPSRGGPSQ